ncbi:MAG: agmatine deiminase family protein [Rhodothermales bacterium]
MLAALLLAGCVEETYQMPAEWEPHDAVWITFLGGPTDAVSFEIARAVGSSGHVKAVVPALDFNGNPSHRMSYLVQARLSNLGLASEDFSLIKTDSLVQVRDTGPIFVQSPSGHLGIADFRWNNYGEFDAMAPGYQDSYPFDTMMAEELGLDTISSKMVMEGGSIDVNGKGTALQVEAVALQRNPSMDKAAIEAELARVLGQTNIIWLKDGLAEDPHALQRITEHYVGAGTGGHVDAFARFVDASTVLLAYPDSAEAANDPVKRITRVRMQENEARLQGAVDQDGQPLTVIRVPVPDVAYEPMVVDTTWWQHPYFRPLMEANPQFHHGDTLRWVPTSSYLNYFVTNGVVVMPTYGTEEDLEVQEILQSFYPNRRIVGIDPALLNDAAGGLHCWTQQQPAAF